MVEKIGTEPEKGENVTTVIIRLSDGEKIKRRFLFDDPIQKLFDFVHTKEPLDNWKLVSSFPRKVISKGEYTLQQCELTPQGTVFVEEEGDLMQIVNNYK